MGSDHAGYQNYEACRWHNEVVLPGAFLPVLGGQVVKVKEKGKGGESGAREVSMMFSPSGVLGEVNTVQVWRVGVFVDVLR